MSNQDKEPVKKERVVGYLVYPWELDEYATAEKVLPMLERLHHQGYAVMVASIYLKSTSFYSWDRHISRSLIKKADVLLLVHEEHITPIMLWELEKGRGYGKPVVRIMLPKGER